MSQFSTANLKQYKTQVQIRMRFNRHLTATYIWSAQVGYSWI